MNRIIDDVRKNLTGINVNKVLSYLEIAEIATLDSSRYPVFEKQVLAITKITPCVFIEEIETHYMLHLIVGGQLDGESTDLVIYNITDIGNNEVSTFPTKCCVNEDGMMGIKVYVELPEEVEQSYVEASMQSADLVLQCRRQLFRVPSRLH